MLRYLNEEFPDTRVGLFSNSADTVIRAFLGAGWGGGTYNNCEGTSRPVPQDVYEAGLLRIRDAYDDRAATYYIGTSRWLNGFGRGHTALRSPTF